RGRLLAGVRAQPPRCLPRGRRGERHGPHGPGGGDRQCRGLPGQPDGELCHGRQCRGRWRPYPPGPELKPGAGRRAPGLIIQAVYREFTTFSCILSSQLTGNDGSRSPTAAEAASLKRWLLFCSEDASLIIRALRRSSAAPQIEIATPAVGHRGRRELLNFAEM